MLILKKFINQQFLILSMEQEIMLSIKLFQKSFSQKYSNLYDLMSNTVRNINMVKLNLVLFELNQILDSSNIMFFLLLILSEKLEMKKILRDLESGKEKKFLKLNDLFKVFNIIEYNFVWKMNDYDFLKELLKTANKLNDRLNLLQAAVFINPNKLIILDRYKNEITKKINHLNQEIIIKKLGCFAVLFYCGYSVFKILNEN